MIVFYFFREIKMLKDELALRNQNYKDTEEKLRRGALEVNREYFLIIKNFIFEKGRKTNSKIQA